MSQPITVTTVAEGVARLVWSADTTIDEVRREVALALVDHPRVETLVDPDDQGAQRAATWAGMHREGVMRGVTVEDGPVDRIVYARLATDAPVNEPGGFRALLNSFLPRKRAISQMLVRDPDDRVLLCQLTYKHDWDLPGGVVEVGESPRLAAAREVEEELGLSLEPGPLLLTDWLPAVGWLGRRDLPGLRRRGARGRRPRPGGQAGARDPRRPVLHARGGARAGGRLHRPSRRGSAAREGESPSPPRSTPIGPRPMYR